MSALLNDLRYSWRALLHRPLFTFTAVVTLAIAIGGNLTIGAQLYSQMFAPLPYRDGERLAFVTTRLPKIGIEDGGVPAFDYLRWRDIEGVEAATAFLRDRPVLAGTDGGERVEGARIEAGLLDVFGVRPLLGAPLAADDEDGVLLGEAVWQRVYGRDAGVVGRTLRIEGRPRIVRGVLPAAFSLPDMQADYFFPLRFTAEETAARQWTNHEVVLRLAPGVSPEQMQARIEHLEQARRADDGDEDAFVRTTGYAPRTMSLREMLYGDLRPALLLLQGAVLGVLLLACANVAHLQLLRASQRRAELGLRRALGAGHARLARLVLSESLLLAALGGGIGVGLAIVGTAGLRQLSLFEDGTALAPTAIVIGAVAMTVFCALCCALPAMLGFWREGAAALRPGPRVTGSNQAMPRLRQVLVVAQTALTVVLLIGAGLLLRSFGQIVSVDPGFHRSGVLTAVMRLQGERYADEGSRTVMRERVLEAVRALPGVAHASVIDTLPFGQSYSLSTYSVEGQPAPDADERPMAVMRTVDVDYFAAMGVPLQQGRLLGSEDAVTGDGGETRVLVDTRFAQRHFREGDVLGQRIVVDGERTATIVGVVGAVRQLKLDEVDAHPSVYRHHTAGIGASSYIVVRSDLPLSGLIAPMRDAMRRLDAELLLYDVRPLDARIDDSLAERTSPLTLLGLFAAAALALAAIGQYGLMAWSVVQRENELGLRMAIGARRRDILWLVVRGGARLTLVGLFVGVVLAAVSSRALSSQLYGIGLLDPLTYVAVAALLLCIAFVACFVPALRATRIAPAVALRGE